MHPFAALITQKEKAQKRVVIYAAVYQMLLAINAIYEGQSRLDMVVIVN